MDSTEPNGTFRTWLYDRTGRTFSRLQKILLLAGCGAAGAIAFAVWHGMNQPAVAALSGSILQPNPILGVLAIVIIAAVAFAIVTPITRRVRTDAPLFCFAMGLLAIRLGTGGSRYVLLTSDGRRGLGLMAIEATILLAVIVLLAAGGWMLRRRGMVTDDRALDGCTLESESIDQKLLCTATVALVCVAGLMILCQSDHPGQTLWAVFLSSVAAAWCAFRFVPTEPAGYFAAGPLMAAIAGYFYTWLSGAQRADIGLSSGMLAAVARPVPLDFASVGVAGALIGYWLGRRQHRVREDQAAYEASNGDVLSRN